MELTPRAKDRLLIFTAALLTKRRDVPATARTSPSRSPRSRSTRLSLAAPSW
jgi:hypothetical protein